MENTNKCLFVTGGSRGIGAGCARVFASKGYDVAFTYHSEESEAAKVAEEIRAMGRRCFYYQASMQDRDVPTEVTRRAIADLGRLDTLICCAGLTRHNLLTLTDPQFIDEVYALNYRAYVLCAAEAARYMQENGVKGSILFISSTRGERAYATDAIYGGFKAALNRSAQSFALELSQYGIRVNVIAPGGTVVRGDLDTSVYFAKKVPLGRLGHPNDIGSAAYFLASDEASYITGVTLRVDGGLILPGMPEDSREENGWRPDMEMMKKYLLSHREVKKNG